MSEQVQATSRELARALAEAAAATDDKDERALLLHEAADINERVLGDELGAAKGYLAAFNARPVFRPPLFGLIRLYTRRRSVTNLAKLFEALIKAAPDAREKASALVQRGELLEDRLEDAEGGRGLYEEALLVDPNCRSAWLAIERQALKAGDSENLRRALAKLADLTRDHARKARLLTELAAEYAREGTPEALDEASRYLREAAALPLGRWRALVELERFAEAHARAADLVFALEGRAALAGDVAAGESFQGGSGAFAIARLQDQDQARDTAADLWARAARVRLLAMNDPEGAQSAMDQALALKPEDPRFRLYAMDLADQAGMSARAAQHAAWLLEREFGDASFRGALHFRIAESAAAEGDLQAAADALRAARAANPTSATALGAVIDQLVASGDGAAAAAEFDRLAEAEDNKKRRAALYRTGAMYALAISGDAEGAARRFRFAAAEDPQDATARRALVVLLGRSGSESAKALCAAIDELLPLVQDDDERVSLLLRKFFAERYDLRDAAAAAASAEALAKASGNDAWALATAAILRAACGGYAAAAKWAEALAESTEDEARRDWAGAAVRLHWAAGDEARARTLATYYLDSMANDPYLAALAFRLFLAANDRAAAVEVLMRKSIAAPDEEAARWLLVGAVLLAAAGARDESRKVLEAASERTPDSPAVRAALLATTRWRADTALRTRLAEVALDAQEAGDEEVALGVELVLAKAFLEHDLPAASEALEKVVAHAKGESLAVALLNAIVVGSQRGPDAEETVAALQGVLGVLPAGDPLRAAIELEVARALASTAATRDQAREVRELIEEEQQGSVAPRLLALLDAIQREDRREVPTALCRVADGADEATAAALRSAAMASLRAQGRWAEARGLAMSFPELPASAITLAELPSGLEHASGRGDGFIERRNVAAREQRPAMERRAAVWCSLAGRNEDAVATAEFLLKADPEDLVAWDVLRVAGRRAGRWERVEAACVALAERVRDAARAAALWEEAGVVAIEHLRDARRAEPSLRKALEHDPQRTLAYQRLREILEARKDNAALERLVTTRIAATQEPEELTRLFWEQARLRRALGRREEALESAKNVVLLDPEHVAALALVAEVHATSGRLAEAAEALVQLAAARETPEAQRKVARLGAADIFEHRLKLPERAIEQLDALVAEGAADDKLIERGVEVASRAELWDAALRFARLAAERANTSDARARTHLRVAEILRDRLRDPGAALRAAQTAHDAMPRSLSTLRTVHGLSDEDERVRRARRTVEALREAMRVEGPSSEHVLDLEQAARLGGDLVLARAAQRLARALGAQSEAPPLAVPVGRPTLRDPGLALRFRDPEDAGPALSLLEAVMHDMAELAGVSTDALGVGRSDRVKGASALRDALAPFVMAAGFNEFEIYVGGSDEERLVGVPGDPVVLVLGRRVVPPFDEATRFRLVRALLLTGRGLAPLQTLGVDDATQTVLAALAAAEVPITGGTARFEARLKPVARALSRKVRKSIAESGRQLASGADPHADLSRGVRAALSSARRGALALSGAVGAALAELSSADASAFARRELCLFAVSDALVSIERETGVDRG